MHTYVCVATVFPYQMTLRRPALCQSPAGPPARLSPSARPVWGGCGSAAPAGPLHPQAAPVDAETEKFPWSREVSLEHPQPGEPGQAGQPARGGAAGAAVCRERARRAAGGRHLLCAAGGSAASAPSSAPSSSFSLLPLRSAAAAGQERGDRDSEGRGEGGGRGSSPAGAGGPRGACPGGSCGPSARPAGRPGPAPHGISCKHVQL